MVRRCFGGFGDFGKMREQRTVGPSPDTHAESLTASGSRKQCRRQQDIIDLVPCRAVLERPRTPAIIEVRMYGDVLEIGPLYEGRQRVAVGRFVKITDDGDVLGAGLS